MNAKFVFLLISFCIMISSSSASVIQTENDTWDVVEKLSDDIDNDQIKDNIVLSTYKDKDTAAKKYKITINENEKILFDSQSKLSISSLSIKQLVKLGNGKQGVLIKMDAEGETSNQDGENAPPYWFDHNFIVISYSNGELITLLDGISQTYNSKDNYKVKYIENYDVEFRDNATQFKAKYTASLYKSTEDGLERLKSINDNQNIGISRNYYNIEVRDINSDKIDEIICSKYIPGLYHADLLGIIDYIFELRNGKYVLSKEILRYDGDSGPITVKELAFNMD